MTIIIITNVSHIQLYLAMNCATMKLEVLNQ